MDDIIKLIAENGILVMIAVVFIWNTITSSKTTGEVLSELRTNAELQNGTLENLSRSGENMAVALNIIQSTLETHTQLLNNNAQSFERHDRRAEHMNGDVQKMLTLLSNRPCISESEQK